MRKWIVFLLLFLLLGCGGGPNTIQRQATGIEWQTGYETHVYEAYDGICLATVETAFGEFCVVHDTNYRWANGETINPLSGNDWNVEFDTPDCLLAKPENPEAGDQYCTPLEEYFLVFEIEGEEVLVPVEKEIWEKHEPSNTYELYPHGYYGWQLWNPP